MMSSHGELSERIRHRVISKYLEPARAAGQTGVLVIVRDLMRELEAEGFPKNHPHQFCSALEKKAFLKEQQITIARKEGPPSGRSTTVRFHYRLGPSCPQNGNVETPKQRAARLTQALRGCMAAELRAAGGTMAFLHALRSDEPTA